jgi:hypothetical protein
MSHWIWDQFLMFFYLFVFFFKKKKKKKKKAFNVNNIRNRVLKRNHSK